MFTTSNDSNNNNPLFQHHASCINALGAKEKEKKEADEGKCGTTWWQAFSKFFCRYLCCWCYRLLCDIAFLRARSLGRMELLSSCFINNIIISLSFCSLIDICSMLFCGSYSCCNTFGGLFFAILLLESCAGSISNFRWHLAAFVQLASPSSNMQQGYFLYSLGTKEKICSVLNANNSNCAMYIVNSSSRRPRPRCYSRVEYI